MTPMCPGCNDEISIPEVTDRLDAILAAYPVAPFSPENHEPDCGAADTLMGIFGYTRVEE